MAERTWTLEELNDELARFERALKAAGKAPDTVGTYVGRSRIFLRWLADGWAYARFYDSEADRRAALPGWLHFYNHHQAHSAIGGRAPVSRLTNVPGHHS